MGEFFLHVFIQSSTGDEIEILDEDAIHPELLLQSLSPSEGDESQSLAAATSPPLFSSPASSPPLARSPSSLEGESPPFLSSPPFSSSPPLYGKGYCMYFVHAHVYSSVQ